MTPLLLAYPGNGAVAEPLRSALQAESVRFAMRRFPDGETYLRIESDVRDSAVVLVCSLRDPNSHFVPLIFMRDTLRELGAREVGLVAPYLAYMRQDRRFLAGEAVTSTSFASLLSARFDWIVTVDPHLHRRHSLSEIYTIPAEAVHAAPLLSAWIRANVTKPVVVGPDSESEQWVREVAGAVDCPYVVLKKIRRGDRTVVISADHELHRWSDHTPVLVDDIISSAVTMSETLRQFAEARLPPPVCLGVHGVFASGAYEMLRAAGASRIVTTNSIEHVSNDIDVSAVLVAPMRRLLGSVSEASTERREAVLERQIPQEEQ